MKRMWLVGNGASLNHTPLDLLKNEDCFGMNRVDLFYNKTNWRPTHYICYDIVEGSDYWKQSVQANKNAKLFLSEEFSGELALDDVTWISKCKKHHWYASDNVSKRLQSWHLPEVCTAIGTMSAMMQIAVLLGYEEIYLLGCDLWQDGEINHFTKDYVKNEDIERRNFDALYLHTVAKISSPIPIYNATVGGHLEIYPRTSIEQVLYG
jgi:hypothetical protein